MDTNSKTSVVPATPAGNILSSVLKQTAPQAPAPSPPSPPINQPIPTSPVPVIQPVANNSAVAASSDYQQLMDEEHQLMRNLPEDLEKGKVVDGYKEMKGPELQKPGQISTVASMAVAAEPIVAAAPVTPMAPAPPMVAPIAPKSPVVQLAENIPVTTPVIMPVSSGVTAPQVESVVSNLPPVNINGSGVSLEAPASLSMKTDGRSEDETLTYKNQLNDLLTLAIEKDASDLHIVVDYPPQLRIDGQLVGVGSMEMTAARAEKMFNSILDERLAKELEKNSDVDFSYPHKSGNRFRVNLYFSKGALAGAFRLIPSHIKSIADLNLPQIAFELIKVPQGLILFTGPTGSGKSTSIAAMIQEINLTTTKHIITIEDPIEYVFPKARSVVNQREIGEDTTGWQRALRELLREDPNVVLVGEMRDYETIASTITVAETGHLVFATLHTNSASQTIDRIIDVFPEGQQNQVRSQLANVITAVIAQRLIPVAHGGRKAVFEVMIATPGIKNAIREGKTFQIDNMIQTSADVGMITLEKSLLNMIKSGDLTMEEAMSFTSKPDELMSLINKGR